MESLLAANVCCRWRWGRSCRRLCRRSAAVAVSDRLLCDLGVTLAAVIVCGRVLALAGSSSLSSLLRLLLPSWTAGGCSCWWRTDACRRFDSSDCCYWLLRAATVLRVGGARHRLERLAAADVFLEVALIVAIGGGRVRLITWSWCLPLVLGVAGF